MSTDVRFPVYTIFNLPSVSTPSGFLSLVRINMFKPSSDFCTVRFKTVLSLWIVCVALWSPAAKRLTSWLSCVWCFLVFWSLSDMVKYLIVSIPDLCLLLYFCLNKMNKIWKLSFLQRFHILYISCGHNRIIELTHKFEAVSYVNMFVSSIILILVKCTCIATALFNLFLREYSWYALPTRNYYINEPWRVISNNVAFW